MTQPHHPISASRVISILALATVLGTWIGYSISMRFPNKYLGTALIENPAYAAHPPKLSRLRGEMIAREYDFPGRWDTSLEQAGAEVIEAVELKPQPQGLLVSVITEDPSTSRRIALSIGRDLGTPDHEAALTAKWGSLTDITEAEAEDLLNIIQLEYLLNDQSDEAGYASYPMVLQEAAKGNEEAAAFARGEDFQRRQAMLQDLTRKIGFDLPPGTSLFTAYNPGTIGPLTDKPITSIGQLARQYARFGGFSMGGLVVFALLRWKPGFLRPERPEPPAPPTAPDSGTPAHDDPW